MILIFHLTESLELGIFLNMNTQILSSLPVSHSQMPLAKPPRSPKTPSKTVIRNLGLKVTDQRIAIIEVVRSGPKHFTAQEIYELVTEKSPDIGFATVYRFLRKLSENHFVTEVRLGGMPARYEWALKKHHDHLTCTQCQKIVEFENPEIERLQAKVAKEFGFELSDHVLELYGICPDCRK